MPRVAGVYAITNKATGTRYVGSSIDIAIRCADHLGALRRGNHVNARLQQDWSRFGADAFAVDVIESCASNQLEYREAHWIDHYRTLSGVYNQNRRVYRPPAAATEITPADICALRDRLGMTQTAFAALLGVSPIAVSYWERGTRTPTGLYAKAVRDLMNETAAEPKPSAG